MIRVRQATKLGYIECPSGGVADLSYPSSKLRRGRVQGNGQISPIITCSNGLYRITEMENNEMEQSLRIRKLTPSECWTLMGMPNCQKARDIGMSDSQLYRQAGNGIISNCVELLMEHLYKAQYDETFICTDEKRQN